MEPPAKRKQTEYFELTAADLLQDDQPFTIGLGAQVMLSHNAKWVMQHFSRINQNGWRNAYVSTATGNEANIIHTQLRFITSGEWSPDSLRLAFGGQGKVYVYIPGADKRCFKIRVPNGCVHQVWWSDNTTLKVATKQGNINTYEIVDDHRAKLIDIQHHSKVTGQMLVFGDSSAAAASHNIDRQIMLHVKKDNTNLIFITPDISMLNSLAISKNGNTVVATTPEGLLVYRPAEEEPMVLCDEFEACNLCAVSPSGSSYVFTSKNRVFGISDDAVVHNISFDPELHFKELYFTSEKTYVVVLQRFDTLAIKVARHTLP